MEPGFWQLIIILAIVMLLFGTKKLRNIGGDLGGAVKSFRSAMRDEERQGQADGEGHRILESEAPRSKDTV